MLFDNLVGRVNIISEGKFRDSSKIIHIMNLPMFSIFVDSKNNDIIPDDDMWELVADAFKTAKQRIDKIGFPSMHVNAVFLQYPTKEFHVGGKAYGNPESPPKHKKLKHISLSTRFLDMLQTNYNGGYNLLVKTIVHEWAHIWMFNKGESFRNAMKQYYDALISSNENTIDLTSIETKDTARKQLARKLISDLINFTGSYGLTNPDEAWATAIEKFESLHPYHRKRIFELMQTNEPRQLPNKRLQKHIKQSQSLT